MIKKKVNKVLKNKIQVLNRFYNKENKAIFYLIINNNKI